MSTKREEADVHGEVDGFDFADLFGPALKRWKEVLAATVACGIVGFAGSYLIRPKFQATATILTPTQQPSGAAEALASVGALAGLSGGLGQKNSSDQFISFLESDTVSDHIIRKFDLVKLWDVDYESDARRKLEKIATFTAGKKDGLVRIVVIDQSPERAAAMANQYVAELRLLTKSLAVTEAQQRRVFFEQLLQQTRDKLATAQTALEGSGYSSGALNVEPREAAESYARVRAELMAAQVKLKVLNSTLAPAAVEIKRQQESVSALEGQLASMSAEDRNQSRSGDYINRYREFKYEETLFDLFARQYEVARVDESREGTLIQVLDPATPPDRKSSPIRLIFAITGALLGLLASWATTLLAQRRRID